VIVRETRRSFHGNFPSFTANCKGLWLVTSGFAKPDPPESLMDLAPVAFDMGKVVTDDLENSWWIKRHCARNGHSKASTVLRPATVAGRGTRSSSLIA
jgi:hypothetical protein